MTTNLSDADLPPVDRTWWSWSGAHGGLLTALLLRHAGGRVDGFVARSVHSVPLVPADDRPLHASTEVVRRGRSSATTTSTLRQGGAPIMVATALFSATRDMPVVQACPPPQVPAADDCPPEYLPVEVVPFVQHLDFRMAGANRPLGGGDEPSLTAWVRLKKPAYADAEAAVVLLDSMPPALYGASTTPMPAPTADFSVHLTDGLAEADFRDWVLIHTQTEQAGHSWAVDATHLWRPDGTLVAAARQTRRILAAA